jgi:putative transport protein
MEWLGHLFEKYPEMAVYLAIGLGYLIGGLKFRGAVAFGHLLLTTAERSSLRC